jgi:acetyl esterase/lipase
MKLRCDFFSRWPRWTANPLALAAGVALLTLFFPVLRAADVKVLQDIGYKEGVNVTAAEQADCRLDLYLPADGAIRASLLWLHGGGLTGGTRDSRVTQQVARRLAGAGIAVASAEYRKSPAVTFPGYIADSAAAFAWLHRHIASHGGDPARVFIGGHSAGAYLALMVGLDDRYLREAGLDPSALAGVVALSGQTSTHFTVRAEAHNESPGLVVDNGAPLFHVQPRTCPFLLLYAGDDMPLRVEENRLLAAALRLAGCTGVRDQLFPDRNHSTIVSRMGETDDQVVALIIEFLHTAQRSAVRKPEKNAAP